MSWANQEIEAKTDFREKTPDHTQAEPSHMQPDWDLNPSWYSLILLFVFCQDYFIHFELSQLLGVEKTGDPREKPPDHPQPELGLSHTRPELGSNWWVI